MYVYYATVGLDFPQSVFFLPSYFPYFVFRAPPIRKIKKWIFFRKDFIIYT